MYSACYECFKIGRGIMQIWKHCVRVCAESCLTLWDSMDCSLPGFSVHGISQARILEWTAISFSRGSFLPVPGIEHTSLEPTALVGGFFTTESPGSLRPTDYLQGANFLPDINSLCYTLSLQAENRTWSQEDTVSLGRPACKQETQFPSISSQSITQQLGGAVTDCSLILADAVLPSGAGHRVLRYSVHVLQNSSNHTFIFHAWYTHIVKWTSVVQVL